MTGHTRAPTLETERLILRAHQLEDFEASTAMWGDPAVVRHITGKPSTREENWGRFLRHAGHWPLMGFGYWALIEKAGGGFIGDVGFGDFKRDMELPLKGAPEHGWVLTPAAQGKGYASEAVRATLAWGRAHFRGSTMCIISPENAPSIRVAERCGYREFARASYKDEPVVVFCAEA